MFLQTLWKGNLDLDQFMSNEQEPAKTLLPELNNIEILEIPCRAICDGASLYIFVDASSKTYGAIAYSADINSCSSKLELSMARVTPCHKNRLTIPKLVLTAIGYS